MSVGHRSHPVVQTCRPNLPSEVSSAACLCDKGYSFDTVKSSCEACSIGFYKTDPGNQEREGAEEKESRRGLGDVLGLVVKSNRNLGSAHRHVMNHDEPI